MALVRAAMRGEAGQVEDFVACLKSVPLMFDVYNSRRGSPFDEQELEDLVQETLTTVWERLDSYRGRSSLKTWCFGIGLKHMQNALRKKRNGPRLAGENGEELLDRAYDVNMEFDRFEPMYRCLCLLDERTSQVIQLRFFEGLTFPEISERLPIPENSAKTLFYRGLERLRSLLGSGDYLALEERG